MLILLLNPRDSPCDDDHHQPHLGPSIIFTIISCIHINFKDPPLTSITHKAKCLKRHLFYFPFLFLLTTANNSWYTIAYLILIEIRQRKIYACFFFLKKINYCFVIDRMVIHYGELQLSSNHLQCWVDPDCPDFVRLFVYLKCNIYIYIFQMIYIIMQILLPPNYPLRKPLYFLPGQSCQAKSFVRNRSFTQRAHIRRSICENDVHYFILTRATPTP